MFKKIISWLRRPSGKIASGLLLVGGMAAGLAMWGGFSAALAYTNTTEFCVSCHEMDHLVHQEYKQSAHYNNASGVRAGCPDCHVPKELGPKLIRKAQASIEVWHWLVGTYDTPEKFEAHRAVMAESVWKVMTETNSRECRTCHDYTAMDFHKQTARAREKMEPARDKNTPCIECHKGLTHKRPREERDD